jgi:hypothetical protein
MEHSGRGRIDADWRRYRELRARHHEQDPDYELGWRRPSHATAEGMWDLVAPIIDLDRQSLLPTYRFVIAEDRSN